MLLKMVLDLRMGSLFFGVGDNTFRDLPWGALDVVVMGGVSKSNFIVDLTERFQRWTYRHFQRSEPGCKQDTCSSSTKSYVDSKGRLVDETEIDVFVDIETMKFTSHESVFLLRNQMSRMLDGMEMKRSNTRLETSTLLSSLARISKFGRQCLK
ncbi:hypothetical protein N665_0289s0042 [Sinapis alba]|nr:hypothetical protein N665_0289s0042 [Sinapis alba]